MQSREPPDNSRVKHLLLFLAALCLFGGCEAVQYAMRDKDDPKSEEEWGTRRAEWELQNAKYRYEDGTMDRYQYNQVRRRHGLRPVE